jgi:hypothetical protein
MPWWGWVAILVGAVLLIVILAATAVARRRRTARLRGQFGREYDRSVEREGGQKSGEAELGSRVERRRQLNIQPVGPAERERYRQGWARVQAQFVDDPTAAVAAADDLVGVVMSERGYPMADFERRAADISVDHPQVVERYRAGHTIAESSREGRATTEDLRQAMQHFKALFEELLESPEEEPAGAERAETAQGQSDQTPTTNRTAPR